LIRLPTLGGNNSAVGSINNLGQIAGAAETSRHDASCASAVPFQVLRYEPVIWGPERGEIRRLTLPGHDTVGIAIGINDLGQAVGSSGTCEKSALPPLAYGSHALLWERDGSVHDLGNLGAAVVNIGLAINNRGEVVGASSLTATSTPFFNTHAFLWTRQHGIRDLGTLHGDVASGAVAINDAGEAVGLSIDGSGNLRAVRWRNGHVADLNTLVSPDSPLVLLFAQAIDDKGDIAGFGLHKATGEIHAFLAVPRQRGTERERGD